MKRIDIMLVELGCARSRSHAQDLIERGHVQVRTRKVEKPSEQYENLKPEDIKITLQNQFVSRAGEKLQSAINHLKINVSGLVALDIGQSTGGFTDCLLKNGAQSVYGIDVGHSQLSDELRGHPKVEFREGINARDLTPAILKLWNWPVEFDLIVCDVSFISLEKILPIVRPLLKTNGKALCLVKPQFEVGPQGLNRDGIVKDPGLYNDVRAKLERLSHNFHFKVLNYIPSELRGTDGNQEYFIWLSRADSVVELSDISEIT